MSIYRGPGGSGDAVNDSSSEATLVAQLATEAQNSADAAATSETNATNSATAAASSASAASTSASNAATSATNAANSASSASTSATNAANSATAAQTAETAAELAETNAETAETNAASSASAASSSASSASTSATNASNSASAAATSATDASNSASAASTSASNASTSATAAAGSASSASTSASNAATSETNAASSASSASTSASTATTQAGIATTKAGEAATSATNAATSATNASNSASSASTSATNASNSASAAATSETNAAASFDSFDDRYLGSKSSAPSVDNDGNTLLVGALYFNSVDSAMKVWNGTAWLDAYASLSGALIATNNLADLTNAATARTNLGLGTIATQAASSVAITGGAIDGTTVGATTPSTGRFSDLTDTGLTSGRVIYAGTGGNLVDSANLTFNGTTLTANTLNLSNALAVSHGGTGLTSLTAGHIPYGNGTSSFSNSASFNFSGTRLQLAGATSSYNAYDASGTGDLIPFYSGTPSLSAGSHSLWLGAYANTFYGTKIKAIYNYGSSNQAAMSFEISDGSSLVEAMRITANSNVGIGTSSPAAKLHVSGENVIIDRNAGDPYLSFYTSGSATNVNLYGGASTGFRVFTGGSERMRIDSSGNVGVGTSSPDGRLNVVGASAGSVVSRFTSNETGTTTPLAIFQRSGGAVAAAIKYNASNSPLTIDFGTTTSHPLTFLTADTERMRITSAGDVLIGTTGGSAFSSNRFLRINSVSGKASSEVSVFEGTDNHRIEMFVNDTTGILGLNTGSSTGGYGGLSFLIEDVERMRIDRAGNVGIGTSSPAQRLHISSAGGTYLQVDNSSNSITSYFGSSTTGGVAQVAGANPLMLFTNGSERMRIDSSGNVGVGTTTPDARLDVTRSGNGLIAVLQTSSNRGFNFESQSDTQLQLSSVQTNTNLDYWVAGTGVHTFSTNGTERMRIDSSGNLLVGTTSAIQVGRYSCSFAGNTTNGIVLQTTFASTGTDFIRCVNSAGTAIGNITQNGTTTVAYNTSSDYRLKDTISPMTGALATVAQLKPVTYKWKVDGSDGQGFIAHELQEVMPDCVSGQKDDVDAEGNPVYQGIDTSFLVATLTKAIQEQQTLINDLTTRLNALEGK